MISDFFIVWSLVGCRTLSAFTTQVSTSIEFPSGSNPGDSAFWMVSKMAGITSYIGLGRVDAARGRNPRTLSGFKTLGFPSLITILRSGRFFSDHRPCKWEVVFSKWEQYHLVSYTWPRGQIEYCPHHALLFNELDPCDMILSRRIKQGGYIVMTDQEC